RLMLVHETRGSDSLPRGLELAFATPRPWLEAGKSIVVRSAPTSFGPVSYSLERDVDDLRIAVTLPSSPPLASVRLRLRLAGGERIARVELDGRRVPFDTRSGALDLSGRSGALELTASIAAS